MAEITFITRDGASITVAADSGSIMELGLNHEVQGIEGQCGGVCSCATCHVHVAPEYFEITGPPGEIEALMLELDEYLTAYSRLGCQIPIREELDGMVLHVANE